MTTSFDPGQITRVTAFQPETPHAPQDWRTMLGQVVVVVDTESGLQGIGVGGGGQAGIHIAQTVLQECLLGQPANDVERLNREMLEHTVFYGRKGVVVMAISGVDLALWDLRGKAAGKSVAALLAAQTQGTIAANVPTYVTVFGDEDAAAAMATGHAAIKLHVERFGDRPDAYEIAEMVAAVRRRLGPRASIMLDAFARWDLETTLRVAEALAPLGLDWLEEPLPPDDLRGYEALTRRSPIPIAGGEHEYTVEGFQTLIDGRLHAVLQPDVNWCGGLTTLIEIYQRAQSQGLRVCPHRGSEPFALPAIAVLDEQPLAESGRTWFHGLRGAPRISCGRIEVSDQPGFGVSCEGR